jgi:hypothetical protein
VQNYHGSHTPSQERSGILPRLVRCDGFFWLGSCQDGLGLVTAGHVGYDDERDLACAVQGLWKVVSQPWLCISLWLCRCVPTLDHISPLINKFLGWENYATLT